MLAEFASWRDYWTFSHDIIKNQRFFRTAHGEAFLSSIEESSARRVTTIPRHSVLWRAQKGCSYRPVDDEIEVEAPFPPERMKPLADKAHEGRVNPKGIPCLYLANRKETAIAEVRAGIGEKVTLASFRSHVTLRVVDCTKNGGTPIYFEEPVASAKEHAVWSHINAAFSAPVGRTEDRADYAPTQVLAELFKTLGFDGIAYRSAFGKEGYNIALFDLGAADVFRRWVYRIDDVSHSTSEIG